MKSAIRTIFLHTAEILLLFTILALLCANWIPIIVGPRSYKVMP